MVSPIEKNIYFFSQRLQNNIILTIIYAIDNNFIEHTPLKGNVKLRNEIYIVNKSTYKPFSTYYFNFIIIICANKNFFPK